MSGHAEYSEPAEPYTGHAQAGGPPIVRRTPDLDIVKVAVGAMDNNAYLLRCRPDGPQLLIDAAEEPDTLLRLLDAERLELIVTTHRHADHWQALSAVVEATDAQVLAGADDAAALTEASGVPVTRTLRDGDEIRFGAATVQVSTLVGHTPGSIALTYRDRDGHVHLFTGDSLFPGGVGNTHGEKDAFARLYRDVTTKLFDRLPDETHVYPGHGDDTTLGAERPHLPEWLARGW